MKRQLIYKEKSFLGNIFFKILAFIYYALHKIKFNLYYKKILPKFRTSQSKIISVGNITAGGTGKTPFSMWLAHSLNKKGYNVVILIRAYKSKLKYGEVFDGKNILMTVSESGDEPQIAALNTGVPVFIAKKRVKMLPLIEKKYSPDFIILDDGFQYWRLIRDVDIVCVDGNEYFYNNKIIPSGILREPVENIKRADFIIMKKDGNTSYKKDVPAELSDFSLNQKLFNMNYKYRFSEKISENNKNVLLVAGIAKPESFFCAVKLHPEMKNCKIYELGFSDHMIYKSNHISRISEMIFEHKIDVVIVTEKDYCKLKDFFENLIYVKIEIEIENGENLIEKILGRCDIR
ncbi:MAG: tetraacyldisaccharide 4'-kinase [Candidatus Muiribacteriota bacterium]